MHVDAFAIRLRPRGNYEAADLGVRLCQSAARSVYFSYLAVALPVLVLCLASYEFARWLPIVAIWWLKPWLDRTIVFAIARAAFGQTTTPADVWHAQRHVWWSQLFRSLTQRRLSPWRSFTGPIYQLEGLRGARQRKRVLQLRNGKRGAGLLVTSAYGWCELGLTISLASLFAWLAPAGMKPDFAFLFDPARRGEIEVLIAVAYAASVAFLEPFYVASGFGVYINRRVELEAWDLEQELRRVQPD